VLAPAPRTDDGNPPIEEWERDGVLTELARITLSLRLEGVAEVPSLDRLTALQREEIAEACARASDDQPQHDV